MFIECVGGGGDGFFPRVFFLKIEVFSHGWRVKHLSSPVFCHNKGQIWIDE